MGDEVKKPQHDSNDKLPQTERDAAEDALILDAVRDEVRKQLPPDMRAISMQVAMGGGQQAFIEKLDASHVDEVLDYTEREKTQGHYRFLTVFAGGTLAFLVLTAMFLYADKDAVLEQLVTAFIAFLGGFGIGKWSNK